MIPVSTEEVVYRSVAALKSFVDHESVLESCGLVALPLIPCCLQTW
jgi:hypothetical protein